MNHEACLTPNVDQATKTPVRLRLIGETLWVPGIVSGPETWSMLLVDVPSPKQIFFVLKANLLMQIIRSWRTQQLRDTHTHAGRNHQALLRAGERGKTSIAPAAKRPSLRRPSLAPA